MDPGRLPSRAERTGVAAVDDVVASVDGLEGRPLAEHAEVFEQAHQRLRRALDEAEPVIEAGRIDGSAEPGL